MVLCMFLTAVYISYKAIFGHELTLPFSYEEHSRSLSRSEVRRVHLNRKSHVLWTVSVLKLTCLSSWHLVLYMLFHPEIFVSFQFGVWIYSCCIHTQTHLDICRHFVFLAGKAPENVWSNWLIYVHITSWKFQENVQTSVHVWKQPKINKSGTIWEMPFSLWIAANHLRSSRLSLTPTLWSEREETMTK